MLIPALNAGRTLPACLQHLAEQSYRDFELILVESGPESSQDVVREKLPDARHLSFERPLLPHAALNRAAEHATGELLVFTDADAYAEPDWLERLVLAHEQLGPVVVGAVAPFGKRWLDQGAHLAKFDKWLPGGGRRTLGEGPTVNLLLERKLFDEVGPFSESTIHADTALCWRLREAGYSIWFEPQAVVVHHHLHSWSSLLQERYQRGCGFALYQLGSSEPGRLRAAGRAIVSLLFLRLVNQLRRVLVHASQAGQQGVGLSTSPVFASALYAWLLGEAGVFLRYAMRRS